MTKTELKKLKTGDWLIHNDFTNSIIFMDYQEKCILRPNVWIKRLDNYGNFQNECYLVDYFLKNYSIRLHKNETIKIHIIRL